MNEVDTAEFLCASSYCAIKFSASAAKNSAADTDYYVRRRLEGVDLTLNGRPSTRGYVSNFSFIRYRAVRFLKTLSTLSFADRFECNQSNYR